MKFSSKKYTCPCCGYKTLDDKSPGSHLICPVCFWEDDPLQYEDVDFAHGANVPSLRQAQQHFTAFGCCEMRLRAHVRAPRPGERRDPKWKPVDD